MNLNWRIIFYRNASGKCYIEKFVEDLSIEDAKEVVASIAALKELGNKARRPLADYLEDEIYELRARRLKKQFRVLYTFAGRQTILLLTGFVKKKQSCANPEIKESQSIEKRLFCACKRRREWMILTA